MQKHLALKNTSHIRKTKASQLSVCSFSGARFYSTRVTESGHVVGRKKGWRTQKTFPTKGLVLLLLLQLWWICIISRWSGWWRSTSHSSSTHKRRAMGENGEGSIFLCLTFLRGALRKGGFVYGCSLMCGVGRAHVCMYVKIYFILYSS